MWSSEVSIEITRNLRVVLRRNCLHLIITEDAREVFIDGISGVSKIGSPGSSSQELNLNPEIIGERRGEVVGRGEL